MNVTRFSKATDVFNLYFRMAAQPGVLLQNQLIVESNHAFEQLTGKKKGYLINHSLSQVLTQPKGEPLYNLIAESDQGEKEYTFSIGAEQIHFNCKWSKLGQEFEETTLLLFEQISRNAISPFEKELIEDLQEQRDLISLIIETDEYERKKFSDYLHDEVGSLLATCKHQLDLTLGTFETDSIRSKEELKKGMRLVDDSIKMLRHIAMHTAPVSYEFGLLNAVTNLVETINRRGEAHVQFIPVADEIKAGKSFEITLYRIIQELLLNSIKHAMASEITLQIISDNNCISISYEDNGKGFDYKKEYKKKNALGLKKIKQRVELFQGRLQIDSTVNQGTVISIEFNTVL